MKWLLVLALVLPCAAVTLQWDANSETNLAGYRVYHGPLSRQYLVSTNSTTNTTFTITNLVNGTNWFAVTAFDTDGLENDYSDEVFLVWTNRLAKVQGLRIRGTNAVGTVRLLQSTDLMTWRETGIAFVELANGATFFKASAPATLKAFLSAPAPKSGKLSAPPRRSVIGPPPMPR